MTNSLCLLPLLLAACSCSWGRVETQVQDDGLGLIEIEGGGQPVAELPVHTYGFIDAFSDGAHFGRGNMRADLWHGLGPVVEAQIAGRDETARGGLAYWPELPIAVAVGTHATIDNDGEPQVRVMWESLDLFTTFSCGGFLDQNFPGWIGEAQVRYHAWRQARLLAEINLVTPSTDDWFFGVGVQWAW